MGVRWVCEKGGEARGMGELGSGGGGEMGESVENTIVAYIHV